MNQSIKAYVNQGWGDYKEIWLVKHELDKTYNGIVKEGVIVWEEMKEGFNPDFPLLKLPRQVWQDIVDSISETTPPIEKEKVDAELMATAYHLEDMRKLVFKEKK